MTGADNAMFMGLLRALVARAGGTVTVSLDEVRRTAGSELRLRAGGTPGTITVSLCNRPASGVTVLVPAQSTPPDQHPSHDDGRRQIRRNQRVRA